MSQNLNVTSSNVETQIQHLLVPGETELARIDGFSRFSNWIEMVPFVVNIADLFRNRWIAVLTNKRLLLVRVSWIFKRVKSCLSYPLRDLDSVQGEAGLLLATVTMHTRDGKCWIIQRVQKQKAADFATSFKAQQIPVASLAAQAV